MDEEGSYSDEEGSSESDDSHFNVYIHIHMEMCCRCTSIPFHYVIVSGFVAFVLWMLFRRKLVTGAQLPC